MLDVCGGLPFLMAVKPPERIEMSAVYSSYRDVSGILSPAFAALVLTVWRRNVGGQLVGPRAASAVGGSPRVMI